MRHQRQINEGRSSRLTFLASLNVAFRAKRFPSYEFIGLCVHETSQRIVSLRSLSMNDILSFELRLVRVLSALFSLVPIETRQFTVVECFLRNAFQSIQLENAFRACSSLKNYIL